MKQNKIFILIFIISFFAWLNGAFVTMYIFWTNDRLSINEPLVSESINEEIKFTSIFNIENEITKIVWDLSPWVVSIIIKKDLLLYRNNPRWFLSTPIWTIKQKVWWWTWFFVTSDWIILTNKHVISDMSAEYSVITNNWKEYSATVLALDPLTDLAVMQVDSKEKFKTLDFIEHESNINIWQFWIAIWNALAEFQNSVSLWVISWKNRTIDLPNWNKLTGLLQTDAAINPWNSWWPLVDLNGKVMWINTAIVGNTNSLWFSISLSKRKINFILDSIKKYSEIKKPFIWINYLIVNNQIKSQIWFDVNYWAYILKQEWSVVLWSQANKVWLEAWDIILEIDDMKVTVWNDLNNIIQNKIPWDIIELLVLKENWKEKKIKLELWMSE